MSYNYFKFMIKYFPQFIPWMYNFYTECIINVGETTTGEDGEWALDKSNFTRLIYFPNVRYCISILPI